MAGCRMLAGMGGRNRGSAAVRTGSLCSQAVTALEHLDRDEQVEVLVRLALKSQ